MKETVAVIFGFAMLANAVLFIPQAWRIWKTETAEGVSLTTFAGFNALQFIGALHGYYQGDRALMVGMLATLVSCGAVTLLAARYSGKRANGANK
jgi:MtN3 and saliva related transmembrane protein